MNLDELESFKLSDAVKFHDHLNPALWTKNNKLDPEVHDKLIEIAKDFIAELGLSSLKVDDITISGSNAAYSYTPHSDLDLHILVDYNKLPDNEVYKELFNAKKTVYNDQHDIKVHGVPVELYVQDSNQPHTSLGEYSLLKKEWNKFPVKRRANFDQAATKLKYEKLGNLIELALKSKKLDDVNRVLDIIKRYRKAGLERTGEFGPENLSFKAIRKQGLFQKLFDLKQKLRSKELSIEDYDPNGPPPGPEFKPTMPKGTVRVDVSDVYDWYKLGQHISNMKGLGKHDFGQGPPSTILSFGDEDTEHKYIQDLEKTGLTTTDIDPVDPNQPKGMKRQKVDPTYNVNESVKFIEGTNCKNCVWWKKDSEKPVGKDELNKYGGLKPPNKEYIAMSKRVDLVTLPGKDTVKEKGFCYHKDINDWVTERMCCAKWDGKGVIRDYKGESPLMESKQEAVRKIQKFLNKKYNANLDVDGVLGPLTLQSINRFMPKANKAGAPESEKTTRVQGKKVKEVLDTQPSKTNKAVWDYDDPSMIQLNFVASNGQPYLLDFLEPHLAPDEINQYDLLPDASDKYYDNGYFIQFEQKNKRSPWKQGKQGIEGTGAAAEVFGIVTNAILQFVKKKKPTYLYFQAAESNRVSLYSAMVKKILPSLPGWKVNGPTSDGVFMLYSPVKKVTKEASGYIPTEKEKDDPRFKTALTVDVKPDSIKKNAKAFGWNISRAGNPPLLKK